MKKILFVVLIFLFSFGYPKDTKLYKIKCEDFHEHILYKGTGYNLIRKYSHWEFKDEFGKSIKLTG